MEAVRKNSILLIVAIILASLVPFALFFFVPDFIAMFSDFPELWPLRTKVLFSYYPLAILLPFTVVLVWRYWPNSQFRGVAAVCVAVVVSSIAGAFSYWSMAPTELMLEAIRRSH